MTVKTMTTAINEAMMALLLERRYSKDEILQAYLNEVFLGQHGGHAIHGFGLAAQHYFSRPLHELELHETTLLVALVRGASYYNPRKHPERARKRRDLIKTGRQQYQHHDGKASDVGREETPHRLDHPLRQCLVTYFYRYLRIGMNQPGNFPNTLLEQ